MSDKSLFEQWMFEAPGDDPPPDEPVATETPPDVPDEPTTDDGPPDLNLDDAGGDDTPPVDDIEDGPPDLGEDDFGGDDFGDAPLDQDNNNMKIDDKVSSILNLNLYQSYVELLTQVSSQIASMKHNADLLYAITPDTDYVVKALRKLEENMRLYIDNVFTNERYEKNLLFYNKCKNLNKFLNDKFDSLIHKGIKEAT